MVSTMTPVLVVLLLCFSPVKAEEAAASSDPYEKQLIEHLFTNYNPSVRPMEHPTETMNITIGLNLEAIKEVNEKDGTITISGALGMEWNDFYLKWNRADFGNISFFLSEVEKIWRPDTVFYSSISERVFHINGTYMGVFDDGTVAYAPGGISTHSCDFNVQLFPFDTQTCQFVAATRFSPVRYIRLIPVEFYYDATKCNELWFVVSNTSSVRIIREEFPAQIIFTLTMIRKPLYYVVNVIIPLLMLAFLNVVVFRVPPESEEKISLSITILLAFAFWLTMLNDLTPRSSDSIPILGMFITVLMLLSAISTALSVYIVRIHYFSRNRAVPLWAERLCRAFKFETQQCNYGKDQEEKDVIAPKTVSWHAVAMAVDQLAFIVMFILTVLSILACVVGFIVLDKRSTL